jgi:hypothetical protein
LTPARAHGSASRVIRPVDGRPFPSGMIRPPADRLTPSHTAEVRCDTFASVAERTL